MTPIFWARLIQELGNEGSLPLEQFAGAAVAVVAQGPGVAIEFV
jgi:hypothetical protein